MTVAMVRVIRAGLFVLLISTGTAVVADPPRQGVTEAIKVMPRLVESPKLPGGAVILPHSDAKEPLHNGDAVVLSAEEYHKLLETIEQLKKQINPDNRRFQASAGCPAKWKRAGSKIS